MNREHLNATLARCEEPGHKLAMRAFFTDIHDEHGTSACIAGHAAMLAGWSRVPARTYGTKPVFTSFSVESDGEVRSVYIVAREYLDLTVAQANALFLSTHLDMSDVRRITDRWEENVPA
jgi:hypothetical protein